MSKITIEKREISNSRLVLGCMSFEGGWNRNPFSKDDNISAERSMEAALSIGMGQTL